ncbi:hypothetical protein QZH41_000975 [Actinostola sp. cb2023]|nr:hypothetical protein QZH41_000975 [Actinostola sp. cb2023]
MAVNCSFGRVPCEHDNVSYAANLSKLSNNTTKPAQYITETFAVLVTKYTILTLLALFGVIGNIIVVIVTTKRRAFNSSLDLFVRNLAIADLGFLFFVTPTGVVRAQIPFEWPLGEFVCMYVYPLVEIFFGSSVWIIAAIAIERYRNIVRMARVHRRTNQTKRSAKIMFLVWVFSFIVFCIPIYASVGYVKDSSKTTCSFQWTSSSSAKTQLLAAKIYLGLLVIFSYLLPLGVVTLTYVAISRQLNRSNTFLIGLKGIVSRKNAKSRRQVETVKSHEDETTMKVMGSVGSGNRQPSLSPVDSTRLTQNRRAKNILTPVAFLFALSMLPINILRALLIFWTPIVSQPYYRILFFITVIFATANSSMNPLVYSIVSREFRNALKSIFFNSKKAHFKNLTGRFNGRDSTDHRKTELSASPLENGVDEPAEHRNSSRLFLACNTKL